MNVDTYDRFYAEQGHTTPEEGAKASLSIIKDPRKDHFDATGETPSHFTF